MSTPASSPRPVMEVLVGPIASGKTTYAKARAAEGALVVCDDDIMLAVHAGDYGLYDSALKPLYVAVEAAIISHAAALGRDLIIDAGGRTRSRRARFLGLGRSLGYRVVAKCFPWEAAGVHAARRFHHDPRGYTYDRWLSVAREHERQYEPVTPDEGFDT